MSLPTKTAQPLPGGFVFQPVAPELIAVLKRADSTLARLIPIAEKYVPRLLRARTKMGDKFVRTQMAIETGIKVRESRDESAINTFLLTQDVKRSTQLLDEGRDSLLRAALAEFQRLKAGEFDQLAREAGNYFGLWIFNDIAKRGER